MSRRDKLLAKIRNNPNAVRFEELTNLLKGYGFELKRIKGSHHAYTRGNYSVIVARHGAYVSPSAVKEVLEIIDEILEEE